jgi:hypothetical protein
MIFLYKEEKMRKINSNMTIIVMLIALFLNFANGQNVNFNFDNLNNKSFRLKSFGEFLEFKKDQDFPQPKAKIDNVISEKVKNDKLDEYIISAIKYSELNNSKFITKNLKKLLHCGNKQEKEVFFNTNRETYYFPKRIISMQDELQSGCENNPKKSYTSVVCVEGHNEEVCSEKEVCATEPTCGRVCNLASVCVCSAVGIVNVYAGVGCGIATYEVCNWVCEMKETCKTIKDCQKIFVCDRYSLVS